MNNQLESIDPHMKAARQLVEQLPIADYGRNFQPHYDDRNSLVASIGALLRMPGITTPRQIDAFSAATAAIGTGESDGMMVISGGCHEQIRPKEDPTDLAREILVDQRVIAESGLQNVLAVGRNRGQTTKPHSKGFQLLESGLAVPAHMGDLVNGSDKTDRQPNAARLVAGAEQAHAVEQALTELRGEHLPAAHEALHLGYERAFLRTDPETGELYSLSADMLWAGLRTNQLDGEIVELLSRIKNTVGVKIGANSDARHIAGLQQKLNPENIPGKLVLMVRLSIPKFFADETIFDAIKEEAPGSLVMFDPHGLTQSGPNGAKIRHVGVMNTAIKLMMMRCFETGVPFNGVHLETTPHADRMECIENHGDLPKHEGGIDPQLNPRQLSFILQRLAQRDQRGVLR